MINEADADGGSVFEDDRGALMAEDVDWTTAPMPDLVREQHRVLCEIEETEAMYRKLAEGELTPMRANLARLRIIAQARMRPKIPSKTDKW